MTQETKGLLGIGLVTVLILIAGVIYSSATVSPASDGGVPSAVLLRNTRHMIASPKAKVTIVEFADFQCPACAAAYPNIARVLETYKEQVNFVYRDFPLPQQGNAMIAAKAAEAAGEQGKFWEMTALLYTNQVEWSENGNPQEVFSGYAKRLNLKTEEFVQAISGDKYTAVIQNDLADANAINVNSTPTIFINGHKFAAPVTYQNLVSAIEKELQ
jgi:protein-disulfide isomerase